ATARYTLRQYEASTISLEEVFTNTESAFEQLTPELLALQTFLNDLIVTLENDESFQNLSDAQAKMEAYKEHATTIENMIKTTQQITTDFSKEKKEQHEGESLLTSESDTSRQITSAIADIAAMKQSIATAFESTQHTELLPELQETYQSSLDEASRKLKNSYEALIHTQTQLVELDEALQYAGQLFEKQPTALSTLQTGKETIDKSFSDAQGEVDTIAKNIDTILNDVKKANPNVDVYILGYYNTFPYLSEALQTKTDALLISLNDTIEETAKANDVTYVPSFEAFDGHYEEFLPNVKDIHPSQAGYRTLAKQFITEIKEAYPPISKKKR
ncbi:MAG TPA: GDSL-type esterase/lipase family protein, partial [Pseudogracilibacillus sp.]|nr:GDSL-type esterase/lipase family protein [Pseudogracilibacillus sp.]